MYKEYSPSLALSSFIETYWATNTFINSRIIDRILPDGCVDILIYFGTFQSRLLKEGQPYIIGAMTTFSDVLYEDHIEILGIRFRPACIAAFLNVPIYELTDLQTEINLVDSLFDSSFYLKMQEMDSIIDRIKHVDTYLCNKLAQIHALDNRILYATELIRQTHGLITLTDVAQKSCLSLRHFERTFKSLVGLSPKMFQKILRFNYSRKYIKYNQDKDLLTVALNCGYYDHSHLIREFKTFSGNSPTNYRV